MSNTLATEATSRPPDSRTHLVFSVHAENWLLLDALRRRGVTMNCIEGVTEGYLDLRTQRGAAARTPDPRTDPDPCSDEGAPGV